MTKRIIKIKQSNEQGKDEESLEENSDNCKETQSFHSSSESIRDSVYRTADDSIRSIYKSDCAKSDETEAKETAVGHFPILGYTSDGKGSQDWAVTTAHDFKVKILTGVQGENSEQLKQCAEIVRIFITSHLVELGLQHIDFKNKKKYYNTHIYPSSTDKSGYSAGPAIAISVISALKGKGALNGYCVLGELQKDGSFDVVSGVEAKFNAARRYKRYNIIVPEIMKAEVEKLAENHREKLTFIYVNNFLDVVHILFA
ncbi:hypothetical protein ACQ4LE_003572 [Meloidogyne hapla]